MPTYTYGCAMCQKTEDVYRTVENRNDAPECCGEKMGRMYTPPIIFVSQDIHYTSPIDDRPITSMQARREDLARSGCRPYDPEMRTDYDRRQKEADKALDKAVDETVDKEIATMPTRKRELLEAELFNAGTTVEPVRLNAPVKPLKVELHG